MTDPSSPGQGSPLPEQAWTAPPDLVGTVLADRYRILGVIGDGGMGRVYLAEQTTLRKKLAIKVLKHEFCREKTHVERFLQEARAASMIAHENIVSIIDFGPVPGGSVFFAMEYMEGEDLAGVIEREGRLPWPRVRKIVVQVCRALAAAHARGVIHRDLKPANCFVVEHSDGTHFVKLLDFGIAKVLDPEMQSADGLTRTGAVFGTAKYMAPEQASGERVDPRTDIYALGVMMYEMLTGEVPFPGNNFMQVLSRHLTEPPRPPTEMSPDAEIPPAVEAIVMRALAKRRDDRFQSMEELEAAIVAADPSLVTAPPFDPASIADAATYPPSPLTAREPPTEAPPSRTTPAPTPRPATVEPTLAPTPRRGGGGVVAVGIVVALAVGGGLGVVLTRGQNPSQTPDQAPPVVSPDGDTPAEPSQPAHAPEPAPVEPAAPVAATAEPAAPPPGDPPAPAETKSNAAAERPAPREAARREPTPAAAPAPTKQPAPKAPPKDAKTKTKLSAADIDAGLAKVRAAVGKCSAAHGGLPGMRVKVRFTIAGDSGTVLVAKPLAPHAGTPLGDCVAGAIKRARFPKAADEMLKQVTRQITL